MDTTIFIQCPIYNNEKNYQNNNNINNKKTFIHIKSVYYGIQETTETKCIITNNRNKDAIFLKYSNEKLNLTINSTLTSSLVDYNKNKNRKKILSESPTFCFYRNTFDRINETCEGNENCSISISVNNFGDPCSGFNKQMFIQYQCLDRQTLNNINNCPLVNNNNNNNKNLQLPSICPSVAEATRLTWCEPSTMYISCPIGEVIEIICSFYGIDSVLTCPGN